MLRSKGMDEITKFYPTVWAPSLVVEAEFRKSCAVYRISRYGGFVVAWFMVDNNGSRVDLIPLGRIK